MKERPMIFNAEMVRAILDGRKTQTRRIIKFPFIDKNMGCELAGNELAAEVNAGDYRNCTLCPGDRLWVRETWWQAGQSYARYPDDDEYGWYGSRRVLFAADGNPPNEPNDHYPNGLGGGKFSAANPNHLWRKRPSIHMPRWASRITLEITGVRVERLNDISHEDAGREGVHTEVWDQTVVARNYAAENEFFQFWSESMPHYVEMNELFRASFHSLWQSIYGEKSWQANPWVWVIEFKRIEGGA